MNKGLFWTIVSAVGGICSVVSGFFLPGIEREQTKAELKDEIKKEIYAEMMSNSDQQEESK